MSFPCTNPCKTIENREGAEIIRAFRLYCIEI